MAVRILILICALFMAGCMGNSVAPHVVNNPSSQASFDGAEQNSGILSEWPKGARGKDVIGFHVTSGFRARNNALVAKYGKRFLPPVVADQDITPFPDGTCIISPQGMVRFLDMSQWQRNGAPSTK